MSTSEVQSSTYTPGRTESEIHRLMLRAELLDPSRRRLAAEIPWGVEAFRRMLPLLERYGVATEPDLDLDTLGGQLHPDALQHECPFMLTPLVTAWANKAIA